MLNDPSIVLDESYLNRYASFRDFKQRKKETSSNSSSSSSCIPANSEDTPDARMDDAFDELNRALESELLDEIMRKKNAKTIASLSILLWI